MMSLLGTRTAIRLYCSPLFFACVTAQAASVIEVGPDSESLNRALAGAGQGDTLQLSDGVYYGPVIIDKSITLIGQTKSIIDGGGQGITITIDAPDVILRNLTVRNSGIDLSTEDSGIFITDRGDRALVEANRLRQNLIGINLKGPEDVIVRNNDITGRDDLRVNERGNGVQIWNSPGSVIENNRFRLGRDGIFVTTSKENRFVDNDFRDLRFAIHYMYTNHSVVSGNTSSNNHIGYALMYSSYLMVTGNRSEGDRDRGILFNFTNYTDIANNTVLGHPEKCVFIYNSNFNKLHGNHFEGCEIGIHFTAGSEQNTIWRNAFIANKTQVKYVGTRYLEWSHEGRGNYWSDHIAFDLDGDHIADKPYRPNNLTDQIMWRHPLSKILLNSPVLQILGWAQNHFPGLHPGGVVDSVPMMTSSM